MEATADIDPNVIPTASFTLDDDDVALPYVAAEGARCAVWFRGVERFRGAVYRLRGTGPSGRVTAFVRGDLRKFWEWQGWPVPSASLAAQTDEYRTLSGGSEEVFKTAISENFVRLGVPWSAAPGRGLGRPTRAQLRFHPLADKLFPALTADNLIVTLQYPPAGGVVVDVRESRLLPGVLTNMSGIPGDFSYERSAPTATRVIVGGRGEGVEREFVEVREPQREVDWGDITEAFRDARNTEIGSDLSVEGRERLAETATTSGVSSDLVETSTFQFGTTYDVGDRVNVRVGPIDREQQIGVGITESIEEGVVVKPSIGDIEDSTSAILAKQIARLARTQRDTGRR